MSDQQTTRFHGMKTPHLTAALLLVIFAAGGLISWWAVTQVDRDMRADLLQRTQIVAQAVNVERIQALTGKEDDLDKPAYLRFKEQLATVRSVNPQCRFVYLMGRNAYGALFFFLDSEPTGSKDYSPPGQVYDEAPEGYRRVFITQNATTEGPYTDRWGTWVSALIPIHDPQAATSNLASQSDARAVVSNAVDFYRKNGREHFLKELNNPQGEFCKGDLYAFAYDQNMTMLAHPVRPELVGQNLLDKKDWSGGQYFRREIQQVAQSKGSGWVDYEYENPVSKQHDPKTTYIERADDLIICTGAYKRTGSVLAVLGMDIDASDWNWMLARAALPPALLTLTLAAILLAGSALLARRSRITRALPRRLLYLEPALTAAIGLVLTLFAAWMLHEYETRNRNKAFVLLAAGRTEVFAEILRDLRYFKLEGLSHFYEGGDQVTPEKFRQFTDYLTNNQTVQAWEWIPAVPEADKSSFEEAARAAGLTGFEIWRKDAQGKRVSASGRTEYYPVFRIAPLAGNEHVLGYDLGSEPLYSAALEEAKRTGLATGTDPITLVQAKGNQKGMMIYRPVFGGEEPRLLRGFTLAVLQIGTLMTSTAPDNSALIQISLLRKDAASESLAISWSPDSPPTTMLSATRTIFAFGKVFGVTAYAGPEFINLYPARLGWLVILTGLALTVAITFVISGSRRRREELEQLVAEQTTELRESETRLRVISESAQDAILMMDQNGLISYWNPAAERIFGYKSTEAIGQNLHEFIVPMRYHEAHHTAFLVFQQTGLGAAIGKTLDLEARRKDSTEISVQLSLSAVNMSGGWHAVGILRDITARKQAEVELQKINIYLEEAVVRANDMAAVAEIASTAKSEFLANMSHEIRTPMNGVIGMTGLLLDTELNDEQRRYAEIVRSSGESLLGLINDILDFSKIEAKKLDLETLNFDLSSLLDDFASTLAMRAHEKGLELLCFADLDVPTMLRGDPGRLRQILNNLAGNAVKFTPAGEVAVRVSLEERAERREREAGEQETVLLRFSVRDSGIGIPKDKIGLLFAKFSQVDASTTRQYGGTGLGLAISKQLAELMGGEAGVNSEEGKGSEFWFTARLGKQAEDAYMEKTLPADLQNVRVLIVDDNATNREILTRHLASWGMRPTEAMDGPGALQILYKAIDKNDPFRIAVIDMQMPGMDGETLGRIIHADKRMNDIRMVMLTSLGRRGDTRRLEEIGFAAYSTKPIRHQELKTVLSLALGDRDKSTPRPIATRHTARETLNLFAGNRSRILLAEDNITNQQVALGILKKLGLRADAVANGAEALKALETLPYDLVLMDVQMPEMDGIEATIRIRNRERKMMTDECAMMNKEEPATDDSPSLFVIRYLSFVIPIIAMTAHAMQGDRELCIGAGMNDYITKPISPQALAEVLDKWLPKENDDRRARMMNKEEPATDDSHSSFIAYHSSLIFDWAGLMARLIDDENLARMVVEGFLEDIPKQIAAMKGYLETGDVTGIERQAHTIKGASANVGGERLRKVAFEMEKAAKAGDLYAAERHIHELEAQFDQLSQAMNNWGRVMV